MPRNIEIKARIGELQEWITRARTLADSGPTLIHQDDTFLPCARGRLKLRAFSDGTGELIFYQRPDSLRPKESTYSIVRVEQPAALRDVLRQAYGHAGRVRKTRHLFLKGQTRIHIDEVEGLGNFLELEVVLGPEQSTEAGVAIALRLMEQLNVPKQDLVEGAYVDLLADSEKS